MRFIVQALFTRSLSLLGTSALVIETFFAQWQGLYCFIIQNNVGTDIRIRVIVVDIVQLETGTRNGQHLQYTTWLFYFNLKTSL